MFFGLESVISNWITTMEHATVSRFCAIEGVQCEKQIPFLGEWSFFFAYPSTDHWRDFSKHLVIDLGKRGVRGTRWEDVVKGELLFSKVCEGIYGNDFLLAEVTDANANVLLETGYALAAGRQPILLIDKTRNAWNRRLLTTLESCFYEGREQILIYISKLQSQNRTTSASPDRRLPFLERMGIFERDENQGTAYHLRPKITVDWIKRVDKTLKGSFFKTTTMDPVDSVYDEFFPQARKIQESQLIIASLVGTSRKDWEDINANVALLIGFAIGLGKQVLVLQEQPAAPILDLGTVLRPIETESYAGEIVKSWLDLHTQELVSRRIEHGRKTAQAANKELIRGMYLGHPDALQDNNLLSYFVHTKEYEDALNARRTIFIGRRGAGKSANFQALAAELEKTHDSVLIKVAPEDFEFERLAGFLEDEFALANPKLVYQTIWNYILLSEILKALAESSDRLWVSYVSPEDQLRTGLRDFYQQQREFIELDFGSRLIGKLREMSSIPTDLSTDEKRAKVEATIESIRGYELSRRLREFAEKEKFTYFVIADDLDKHWRPNTQQSIELLLGLIAEGDRLQRFFGGCLKIVLFLREDIYDVLVQHDDDLPKRNLLRMEWTASNLKHLVAERMANNAGVENENDETTWLAIFPPKIKSLPSSEYMLSRSLPRPRDVLDFCQKAIDQAQRNGHPTVTETDVFDAESEFSETLFRSVTLEFRALYPRLDEILFEFAGAPEIMPWDDFGRIADQAIKKNSTTLNEWYAAPHDPDPLFLAAVLFRVGVIGFGREISSEALYANGRSFAETWRLVSPTPKVFVHPAFVHALDLSPGTTTNRGYGRVRRLHVDPRQLPMDIPRD